MLIAISGEISRLDYLKVSLLRLTLILTLTLTLPLTRLDYLTVSLLRYNYCRPCCRIEGHAVVVFAGVIYLFIETDYHKQNKSMFIFYGIFGISKWD